MTCRIKLIWDDKAEVWVAVSQDIPGLVQESGSFDTLLEKVRYAIPELIELNEKKPDNLRLIYFTESEDQVAVYHEI